MARDNDNLTPSQVEFLDYLFGTAKGDPKMAAELAGYAPSSWSGVVKQLRKEIIERAENILALHAPRAAHSLVEGLETPTALGTANKLQAATQILDRVGIVKKDKIEVEGNLGGVLILPAKAPVNIIKDEPETAG